MMIQTQQVSGDSTGGDDYWTIIPAAVLPNITSQVTIDGSTQTSNQGDMNTFGPEVEIDGKNTSLFGVFTLNAGSENSTISNLVVNHQSVNNTSWGIISPNTGSISIINNYIGLDVKGITGKSNTGGDNGIYITGANTINLIDGNVISGVTTAIAISNSNYVTIKRNIIGLSADQHSTHNITLGIVYSNSNVSAKTDLIIGGNSEGDRNVIAGCVYAIYYSFTVVNTTLNNSLIKNNLIGTNDYGEDFFNFLGVNGSGNPGIATTNLTIDQNRFVGGEAIATAEFKGLIISNNDISKIQGYGIEIFYSEYSQSNATPPGVGANNDVIIKNNTISGDATNIGTCINSLASSPNIIGNSIVNCGKYGMTIAPAAFGGTLKRTTSAMY